MDSSHRDVDMDGVCLPRFSDYTGFKDINESLYINTFSSLESCPKTDFSNNISSVNIPNPFSKLNKRPTCAVHPHPMSYRFKSLQPASNSTSTFYSEKRRRRMKKIRQEREFLRLRSVIPSTTQIPKKRVNELDILRQAVKHITDLENRLYQKLFPSKSIDTPKSNNDNHHRQHFQRYLQTLSQKCLSTICLTA